MKKVFFCFLVATTLMIFSGGEVFAQALCTVSGTVKDAQTGEPVIGAGVISSSGSGTVTDIDGAYSLEVASGATLVFSAIGYEAAEFVCPATDGGKLKHDVLLEQETLSLDDVVVVAYGVRKKGTVTGSVSTVKSEALADVPAASFDQALQGKSPGLSVIASSGEPSSPAKFSIRGTNSINSGTEPLFILDGVPITSSDFNTINPNDIESVSVLKDASSTSIYGARAANGVIVITTKRGKTGTSANVQFRMQAGVSQLAHGNWNMMDTSERIAYEKEVGLDAGKDYAQLARTDVNWLDEVFRDNAVLQSYDLQVNGATEKINYYISGGYFSQEGIAKDSDFSRLSFRTNLSFDANDWLSFGTNTMLAYEDFAEAASGSYTLYTPISAARFMLPYWNPYREDGSLASAGDGSWTGTGTNPLEWAENNPYRSDKYKVLTSAYAEIRFMPGLVFKSTVGADYSHKAVRTFSYPSFPSNDGIGNAARNSVDYVNLTVSNTLNWQFDVNDVHNFIVMLGQEGVKYRMSGFSLATSGQSNDHLSDVGDGTIARTWSSTSTAYSYLSFFGRGEYNYANKYFVDLSLRGDGSSRFGKEGRWAPFWSVGLMWNIHNEPFARELGWLTSAQLAVSSGTSGNSSIPDFEHLALVSGGLDYDSGAAIAPSSKGNEKLAWEKLWSSNIALRLGFFNRFNLDIEFYNKLTTDMLMAVPVSYADAGFGYRWDNVGGMVNRGLEVNLSADVMRAGKFVWNVNANVSYNRNRITGLYNGLDEYVVSTTGQKLVVGHSYGEFFLNRYAGVNAANGDPLWYDRDGNITAEYNEADKVMVGKSSVAPWQGGFGTTLSWNGLSLTAQFSWVADRYMINNDRYFEENSLFGNYNQSRRMLYDRWKKPGDVTDIPRYGTTPQFDTHLLEDASFLRLKNLMLSYNLPSSLFSNTKVFRGARVYAQAQNLLTFTGFSGLDPESPSNVYQATYPMSKQFTFGFDINF